MKNHNPFENINKVENQAALQEQRDGRVVRKRAGRPKKPNSQRLQIRQDTAIIAKMRSKAERQGLSIGAAYAQAALLWLREKDTI